MRDRPSTASRREGGAERRRAALAGGPSSLLVARRAQPWIAAMIGMIRIATRFAILIIGLIAGPAVSL